MKETKVNLRGGGRLSYLLHDKETSLWQSQQNSLGSFPTPGDRLLLGAQLERL